MKQGTIVCDMKSSYLKTLVQNKNGFVEFFLYLNEHDAISGYTGIVPYHIGDDTGQQQTLLMLVWALLLQVSLCGQVDHTSYHYHADFSKVASQSDVCFFAFASGKQ